EISLFSESYARFKHLLEESAFLYIEGEYKQRYNSEDMELRVNNIRMLDSIGEEKTQSITVKIPVSRVSADLAAQIERLCSAHKGNHPLRIELLEATPAAGMRLTLVSQSKRVMPGTALSNSLHSMGLDFGVVKV
ncbi:MAG TPA: hypothetical protein PK971_11380, partial [Saprospiraceae bacterium]|nr:hypothetical protein [Saprospiraceae bacterium]